MAQQASNRRDSQNFVFDEISPSAAWTYDGNCHYLLIDVLGFKKEWLKLQIDEDSGYIKASGERQESENKIVYFEQNFKLPENSDRRKISGRYEGEILYVIVPKQVKEEEGESRQNRIAKGTEEKHKHEEEEEEKNVEGIDKKPEEVKEDEKHVKGTANVVEEKHEDMKEKEKSDKENANVVEEKHRHGEKEEEKRRTAYVAEDKHEHRKQNEGVHMRTVPEASFHDANSNMRRQEEAGLLRSVVKILKKNKGIVITVVLAFSLGVLVSQRFQSNIGTERPLSPV